MRGAAAHVLYRWIIRLHPPGFRKRFGAEMELDFDQSSGEMSLAQLYGDALLSLARQWTRVIPSRSESGAYGQSGLLAGRYVSVVQSGPGLGDLFRAWAIVTPLWLVLATLMLSTAAQQTRHSAGLLAGVDALVTQRQLGAENQEGKKGAPGQAAGQALGESGSPQRVDADGEPTGKKDLLWKAAQDVRALRAGSSDASADEWRPWAVWCGAMLIAFAFALYRLPRRTGFMAAAALMLLLAAAPTAFGKIVGGRGHWQILHEKGPALRFEVASIRPWQPTQNAPPPPPPDGTRPSQAARGGQERLVPLPAGQSTDRVEMILPARLLVAFAYGFPLGSENRVLGGTIWMDNDQYQIQARIPEGIFAAMRTETVAEQAEKVARMEQSLLADRFKLRVHFESRVLPAYVLSLAKNGPKLHPAQAGETPKLSLRNVAGGLQMNATAVSLDAWLHSPFLGGRSVVDQTHIKGEYDFQLSWKPQGMGEMDDQGLNSVELPALAQAIEEQLGLRLTAAKAPLEVIIIDHIERPSPN